MHIVRQDTSFCATHTPLVLINSHGSKKQRRRGEWGWGGPRMEGEEKSSCIDEKKVARQVQRAAMSYGGELSPSFSVTVSSGLLPVKMNAFQHTHVSFTALLCHLSRLFQCLTFCIFALSGEGEQGRDRHRTSGCIHVGDRK